MTDTTISLELNFNDLEPSPKGKPVRHLFLQLHGMWSVSNRAHETERHFAGKFEDITVLTCPISYALVGPIQVILNWDKDTRKNLVTNRINRALADNDFDLASIQCHSFGTKVFSTLSTEVHQVFEWIFFAGSVCHINDDQRFAGYKSNIINDCGLYDAIPVFAAALRGKIYGHTGVVGFNNPPFTDRIFPYGHSRATSIRHLENWIVPILRTNEPKILRRYRTTWWHLHAPIILRIVGLLLIVCLIYITAR